MEWAKYLKAMTRAKLLPSIEETAGDEAEEGDVEVEGGNVRRSDAQGRPGRPGNRQRRREDDGPIRIRERIAVAIWKAVKEVARISWPSAEHTVDVFVCMESI